MRRISTRMAVLVAVALSAGVLAVTTSSAPAAPIAYTTLQTDGCQLATIDLATGVVTPLADPPSGLACVDDLAVAPNGTVYGIRDIPDSGMSANLVTFDATGNPSATVLTGNFTQSFTAHGGIAVDANGVVYAQFVTNETGCSDLQSTAEACLYTVNPATGAATLIGSSTKNQVRMFWLTTNCAGQMRTGEALPNSTVSGAAPDPSDDVASQEEPSTTAPADDIASFAADVGAQEFGLDVATVSSTTGAVTTGPFFDGDLNVFGLEWAPPDGPLYALGDFDGGGDAVFTINPATGAHTHVVDITLGQFASVENLAMAVTCPTEAPIVVTFTG